MERYFNTLKNEYTNLYEFQTEEELYRTVEEFALCHLQPRASSQLQQILYALPGENSSMRKSF